MKDSREMTDLHLAILGVLWDRGEATVTEVHAELERRLDVTRKTVATLLGRLEQRGYVSHRTDAVESIYAPTVTRRSVLVSRMLGVLGAMLETSADPPGARALDPADVRPGDVARLKRLLERAERDLRKRS